MAATVYPRGGCLGPHCDLGLSEKEKMTYTDMITALGAAHKELREAGLRASDAYVALETVTHRMADFDGSETDAKVTALDYVVAKANLEVAERVRSAARDEFNRSYLVLLRAGVPQFER